MSVESDIELPERTYSIVSSPSQIEVVTDGIKAYVRLPGQEWQTMEEALGVGLEEMGFDPPDFEAQLEFARLADRIDILPDDEVEGIPVYHLRVSMSAEDVFDEYSAMMGASGDLREVLESAQGGSVEANYYIGHDDFLLRRGEVAFTTTVLGTDLQYDGDTVFSAFNEPVDIPEVE